MSFCLLFCKIEIKLQYRIILQDMTMIKHQIENMQTTTVTICYGPVVLQTDSTNKH